MEAPINVCQHQPIVSLTTFPQEVFDSNVPKTFPLVKDEVSDKEVSKNRAMSLINHTFFFHHAPPQCLDAHYLAVR